MRHKKISDYYGIDIGIGAEYDYGDIDVDCISKYFDKAWDLLTEAVVNPTFDGPQLELLRKKILASMKQSNTNPEWRAKMLALQNAFAGTSYEANPGGTEEVVASLTAEQLSDYYKSILNKGQIFIVVAGNITKEELVAKIHASFGALPEKEYHPEELLESVWTNYKVTAEKRDIPINYAYGVLNAPAPNNPDFLAYNFSITVLNSLMYTNLRNRLHLSYNQGANYVAHLMPYTLIYVNSDNPSRAVREMLVEVATLKSLLLSPNTVNNLVNNYIDNYYLQQQSTAAITADLGSAELYGTWDLQQNLTLRLNQVTATKIQEVFDRYTKGVCWGYIGDTDKEKAMEANQDFKP
jgi:zinc protease